MRQIFGPHTDRVLKFLADLWLLSPEQIAAVTAAWKETNELDRAEVWAQLHRVASGDDWDDVLAAASVARRQAMDAAYLLHRVDWAFWAAAWDAAAAIAAEERIGSGYYVLARPLATVMPSLLETAAGARVPAQRADQRNTGAQSTGKKLAGEAMKSRFLQLFEHYPDAMVIVDRAGQIHQANSQAEELFGYDHNKLRGESVHTLFPGQSATLSLRPWSGDDTGRVGRHLDLVGSSSDLRQFPADVNVIPIQTERGTASVMSIRDITEVQRAQFVLDLGLNFEEASGRDRQDLLDHLIRAQEEERGRIAADIHDETIQVLAAANLRIQQLRDALGDPDQLDVLDKLGITLSMAMSHLRQLIFNLRPPSLEHGSVATALRGQLDDMKSATGVSYQLDDSCTDRLSQAARVLIYRSASEALANVRKHARASRVRVQFRAAASGCLVRIVDDGVGYNPAEVEQRPGHAGLTLIRERAQIAGGWSRIESTPGAGTTVEFWIPNHELPGQPEAGHDRVA